MKPLRRISFEVAFPSIGGGSPVLNGDYENCMELPLQPQIMRILALTLLILNIMKVLRETNKSQWCSYLYLETRNKTSFDVMWGGYLIK